MRSFFQIGYFVVGLVQLLAVWDGVEYLFGFDSFFGSFVAFFVSLFLAYIPIVGSLAGVYGAVNVWDWSLVKSLLLFFWYVPVVIVWVLYSFATERKA